MKKQTKEVNPRLGKVGGQAVLEGVMMRSGDHIALSVRRVDGKITTQTSEYVSVRKKHKILNLPIIRGVVAFVESLKMSFKTLTDSADMLGIEEEETKFEKWLKKKCGASIMDVLMPISVLLGVALALGLFLFLPVFLGGVIAKLFGGEIGAWRSVIEGVIKIAIFVAYLLLVSLMRDIRRTFEYHGAEHKSIFCYEKGEELTVANVKKQKRFHPRCGTSFLFVMLIIGIVLGFLIPFDNFLLRSVCRLGMLLPIMGIGYEFLMFAGKHDNVLTRVLSAPGLWMQRITTREPDDSQMEVAIASLKAAMPEVFPPEAAPEATDTEAADAETAETEMSEAAEKETTDTEAADTAEPETTDTDK